MRCIIYSRVSTDMQDTENQIAQLREYADKQHWEIVTVKTDICSGSKSSDARTGLKEIFDLARKRQFDILLFWSLDRLSREGTRQTLEYLSRFDGYKVKWHSYTEEYISSLGDICRRNHIADGLSRQARAHSNFRTYESRACQSSRQWNRVRQTAHENRSHT